MTIEKTGADSLGDTSTTRDQQLRGVARVLDLMGAGDATCLAEVGNNAREVLAALFQPPYRTEPSSKPRTHESVLRLNGITESGAE